MSLECDGYARDPAKVEDQVRLLAWTLREQRNRSRLWPASVMDSTTDFESVRRGSTPWRAAQQQTARYANGIAATDPRCACVPDLGACGFESGHRRAAWVLLLGVGTMKANKQFTIRLANGREETFDNGSAMVEWMNRQRVLEYRGS